MERNRIHEILMAKSKVVLHLPVAQYKFIVSNIPFTQRVSAALLSSKVWIDNVHFSTNVKQLQEFIGCIDAVRMKDKKMQDQLDSLSEMVVAVESSMPMRLTRMAHPH